MIFSQFKHVCLESYALNLPPHEVTSAEIEDKLSALYKRIGLPFGTLEKLSGVKTRYFWESNVRPSTVSTEAAKMAMDEIGFDRSEIGALFNCSVNRDFFEPATACLVHRNLELPETCMAMDITNACIGFSNGIQMLGSLIEAGVVKAGVIVTGENISKITESSMKLLLDNDNLGRDDLLKILPTFTLGSGAVAFVLCHDSIATKKHKILGCVARSATQFNDLCIGNGDFCFTQEENLNPIMHTESQKLISSAAKLGGRMWKEASEAYGWTKEDVDHTFCHQVGKQVNEAFYREMGLDIKKEFTVYQRYGNLISAALPSAFITGVREKEMKKGDKILFTAFGSGLNSIFTALEW